MPLVLPPLISEFNNNNQKNKIIEYMNNSLIVSIILGTLIAFNLFYFSNFLKIIYFC